MNRLLQFDGRATRSEYWHFAIIHNTIKAFVTMIEFAWYGIDSPPLPAYFTISGELSLGYAVLAFIPCLAITVRRFHDIGVSGAFFILLHIPFIGPLLFLGLGFIGSEKGENKYGPHPDAPSTLSQEASKDEPKEASKGMMKRITALLLLISILLGVPVSADTGMPLRVFLGDSLLQGPDKDLPVEVVLSSYWEEDRKMFRATWTMPSGRPVEINSELYPSTRSIEEEHFLVGRASSRGNRYHAELMRVDRYPFQVTEEGNWEASEDITLFIPFTDRETETEYFLVSSLTEDQYQQLHQRSVVNYDGYVSAYNDYRRRYDSDFNPEGNTDYHEDYYWKLFDLERAGNHPESVTLTVQGSSTYVNSDGEIEENVEGIDPLGHRRFENSYASTDIGILGAGIKTIKTLDDFDNYAQFDAMIKKAKTGTLDFNPDGFIDVAVSSTETIRIHKEFFSIDSISVTSKTLRRAGSSEKHILVKESGPLKLASPLGQAHPKTPRGHRFSILREKRKATSYFDAMTTTLTSKHTTTLEVEETIFMNGCPSEGVNFVEPSWFADSYQKRGYPIQNVEIIKMLDYHFPENMHPGFHPSITPAQYIENLEAMFPKPDINTPPKEQFDQLLTEIAKDHRYRYLPPLITKSKMDATVTRNINPFISDGVAGWVGLFPYGQYASLAINEITKVYAERYDFEEEIRYADLRGASYARAFSTQIYNDRIYDPTIIDGKEQKGLVKHVGLRATRGYLAKERDNVEVTIEMYQLPEDITVLTKGHSDENFLSDEAFGLQRMPFQIVRKYEMTLGRVPHYFDGTIDYIHIQ